MARLINQGKSPKIAKLMRMETSAAEKEPHNDCTVQSSHFFQLQCHERYKKQGYLQQSYLKKPVSDKCSQSWKTNENTFWVLADSKEESK